MRVLITGATSMIGCALLKKLVENGHQVVAVCRRVSQSLLMFLENELIEIVCCDMKDYSTISTRINGEIDAAVLMAWNGTRGCDRMDAQKQLNNELYCKSILPELNKLKCKVVMTAGSQAEYGSWDSSIGIKETDITFPNTEYGKSKLRFYSEAKRYCDKHQMRLIEPRFFSLYGSEDYQDTLVLSLIRKMLNGDTCELTQCIQLWDYLYISDAVDGLMKLLTEERSSGIYNFGFGECRPLKYFVETIHRLTNSKSVLNYGSIPYPETGMVNVNPDVSKLKSIGWKPRISFEEGIKEILQEYKEKEHR